MVPKPLPPSIRNLADLFEFSCRRKPQELAYAFVRDTLELESQLTYGELEHKVRSLAGQLARKARPGARALLLYPPGFDVVCAFWACICAGLVPVPAPAPDPVRRKHSLPRLRAIIEDAQVSLVLTTAGIENLSSELSIAKDGSQIEWMATDQPYDQADAVELPHLKETALAYLQYTSGSTATPRGVMISHGNVLSHCKALSLAGGVSSRSRSLCWLPYFHDYGLLHGIIAPFYAGIPAYLMSPITFLRRPLRWLEAVSRFSITHSGGPNFSYESCFRAARQQPEWQADLSTWAVASCGAEPIYADTVERFIETFGPLGFRRTSFTPAYGLAEATLVVTMKRTGTEPTFLMVEAEALADSIIKESSASERGTRTLLGCGEPLEETRVLIVNPSTQRSCQAGAVGEVWLAGAGIATGYWGRPEESDATFKATLAGSGEGPYLRTGDLGFIHRGELFLTGRLKDLIIVRGRNHYPQDIERTVEQVHPALRAGGGVAVSIDEHGEEHVVVVQEVLRHVKDLNCEEIGARVREAVAEQHELHVYDVVFIKAGSLPKTSSGKVQRRACREAYLANTFPALGSSRLEQVSVALSMERLTREGLLALSPEARTDAVAKHLRNLVARTLSIDSARLSLQQPLRSFGLDSLMAVRLKNQLEESLGVFLPMSTLLQGPTIEGLATAISSSTLDADFSCDATTESSEATACSLLGMVTSPLTPLPRPEKIPLSSAQQRLWFLDQMEPTACLYNLPMAVRFSGPLNASLLEASFEEILRRHEALRTTFPVVLGEPRQVIAAAWNVPFPVIDLGGLTEQACHAEWERIAREEIATPFDLTNGPLMRGQLLRFSEQEHVLLLIFHHIVIDGWSVGVLLQELVTIYEAGCTVKPALLPTPPVQYADFSLWEKRCAHDEAFEKHLAYWKGQLTGASLLDIPMDHSRPAVQRFQGSSQSRLLPSTLVAALDRLGEQHETTRYMTLLTAFFCLLSRYTGQTDVIVGSTMANRGRIEIEPLIGMFVNTVALRADLSGDPPVSSLLERVRTLTLEAYDHQATPFEQVVDALQLNRELSRMPLIQVMFTWEPPVGLPRQVGDLSCLRQEIDSHVALFDLTLSARDQDGEVRLAAEYNTDLFEASTIVRLLGHLETVVAGMAANPEARLSELPLLTAAERQLVVEDWNRTEADYSIERRLPELIAEQAFRTPDAVAVVCGRQQLTYRALMQQAGALAEELQAVGVGPNVVVGLCVERSVEMVVGILAILQAGGAYLPLDPTYPQERLAFMFQDSDAAVLVTQERLKPVLPSLGCPVVCLDGERAAWSESPGNQNPWQGTPDALAYIIYTSGSTGRPKGVMVSHRNLSQSIQASHQYFKNPVKAFLIAFSFAFDGSVHGLFWTLSTGGAVILPPEGLQGDTAVLADLIAAHGVSHLVSVPSLCSQLLTVENQSRLASLKVSILAGEDAPLELVHRHYRLLPDTALFNAYGPTEATIWASVYRIGLQEPGPRVPIGRPIANTALYILDAHQQPLPIGVPGELYISGPGVAQGYMNLPELTAERFLPNPFMSGQRLYRTGDVAKFRINGLIEFLGRRDHQVKVRGYRIELGEIEEMARGHLGVQQALAHLREDRPGQRRVVLYFQCHEPQSLSGTDLLAYLDSHLPKYMVPTAVIKVDVWPITSNGKIDRQALPAPPMSHQSVERAEPRPLTTTELVLAEIWAKVLGMDRVNLSDNFFALGGDSILSLQIVGRAREAGISLTPKQIFQHQTVEELAAAVGQHHVIEVDQGIIAGPVPLTPIQQWFFEQDFQAAHHWNQSILLSIKESLTPDIIREVLQQIARHHDALRLRFHRSASGWQQVGTESEDEVPIRIVDCRQLSESDQELMFDKVVQEVEGCLNLTGGPLFAAVLCVSGGARSKLLLLAHHLVVDGVSWRVLIEDLETGCRQAIAGRPIQFPFKTTSFKEWAERLTAYAQSIPLRNQCDQWQALIDSGANQISVDHSLGENRECWTRSEIVALDERETGDLLHRVSQTLHAHVSEILVSALARTTARWTGSDSVMLDLEGHGREALFDDVDLSRTVGWFTSISPVRLHVDSGADPVATLRSVRRQLHAVPQSGIGFGLLRYLSQDKQIQDRMRNLPTAQICWNYLGQYDHVLPANALFQLERAGYGRDRSDECMRSHVLNLNAFVDRGRLLVEWTYSEKIHRRETIERLAEGFMEELRTLISYVCSPQTGAAGAEHYGLAALDESVLQKVSAMLSQIDDSEGRAV